MLPFVKFLQDQSLLAVYGRLFAGLPVHAPAAPFPLPVGGDKSAREVDSDAKLSPSSSSVTSSSRDYYAARFHPYMHDTLALRNLHASATHR